MNKALSNADFFVSGSLETSRKFISNGTLTLRFIGHFPYDIQPPSTLTPAERAMCPPPYYQIMMGFLTVEMMTQGDVNGFELTEELESL